MYRNIHPVNPGCITEGCMVHNPEVDWVGNREGWAYYPRADGRMERLCRHGVGHPDPDASNFLERTRGAWVWVHGCDGCCS